jgi:uncharacterized membrane protein (UPF0182 family)
VSFTRSPGRRSGGFSGRRRSLLVPILIVLAVLVVLVLGLGGIYTDLLWFRSVGFAKVFSTVLTARITLFLLFGSLVGAIVGLNAVIAYRLRPAFRPMSPEQDGLERYRLVIEPRRWLVFVGVSLVIGVFAGLSAASRWSLWLQWRHGVSFGRKDAQFGRDVSYFVFTYPFQRMVLGYLFTAVVLGLIVAAVVHYVFGALRLQTPGEKVTPAARAHISVLLGIFVLLKAVAYWLDRYGLAFSPRGIVTGPSFTDVNAVLPAKTILAIIALICAGLFIANLWFRGWTLPIVSAGVLVVSAIVIGGVYPALVQQFRVKPNESDREAPYLKRMIESTRFAYGLEQNVASSDYAAKTTADPEQLRADAANTASIRLLDPNVVTPTYDQLQQIRGYYGFANSLDIDRYTIAGKTVDTVIAVRELDLNGLSESQNNWINKHLVFTHGFGVVAAPGNAIDPDGKPLFSERDIPPTGTLGAYEPRIYFGERSPAYSIVGGNQKTELDRPDEASGTGQINTTYQGKGGVALSSPLRRLLYAAKFREKNVLLSGRIGSDSKILYIRDPRKRVAKVAPWLKLDGDPYPAIVDGRIQWIVDGFTTTSRFPYSQASQLGDVTQDANTQTGATTAQADARINYIRNSVKATVDAYDGTVTLYAWDPTDPLLRSWMNIFPGTVKPRSAMSAELIAHVRYPEDMFKVQRDRLSKYHVTDPGAFYNGSDFWVIPKDPSGNTAALQPPYYLTLKMPGQDKATFQLTASYVPKKRSNLAAFVAVSSDAADYGRIRVLQLPRNTQIDGPETVHNNFQTTPKAKTELQLLNQGTSQVHLGNLLTLPVGGGLLYVQPVYVQAKTLNSYPRMQRVLVEFGETIAYESTLSAALDVVFKGTSTPTINPPPTTTPGSTEISAAVAEVKAAFAAGQAALRAGDLEAYARAQKRLEAAINRLSALEAAASKPGSGPSPSPGPQPTASP